MKKLMFYALLCLVGQMNMYATDVVGGTHVTLPTFTTKTGASITATAVNGWSMKSAKVDNSDSWTAAAISGNSASTSYISTSTGKFAVTLSGELVPPAGSGRGPTDFSIKANFDGELYIVPSSLIMVYGDPAQTLTAKMNDVTYSSNWTIEKVDSSNNWTGSAINGKTSITIGKNGDWNPPMGKYKVTATDPTDSNNKAEVEIRIVEISLKKIEFTSDHNVICDGTLFNKGVRFPDIEWDTTSSSNPNAPMTHTAGDDKSVSLRLYLTLKGVESGTTATITGSSDESALNFSYTGNININSENAIIPITANAKIGKQIRKIIATISWQISIEDKTFDIGESGAHLIYTTIGTPSSIDYSCPTPGRMDIAIPTVATAIQKTGSYTNYPKIVWNIVGSKKFNLSTNVGTPAAAWAFPATGADCISIAMFSRNVCTAMGLPGNFSTQIYAAYYKISSDMDRPKTGLPGINLDNPHIVPGSKGETVTAGLDSSCFIILVDGNGGFNNFEAVVVYEFGTTYYFPGGTNLAYTNEDHIVQLFQTLSWVKFGDHDNNPLTRDCLYVVANDYTYTLPPSIF